MSQLLAAGCLILAVDTVFGHLCLLSPQQRGGVSGTDLNTKGSGGCILLNGPCGGKEEKTPETFWKSGANETVVFQKNLDHFNKYKPGYFSVSLLNDGHSKELARIPDKGELSLTIYTTTIVVPSFMKGTPITTTLQVVYVTNNHTAPPDFYQCSDVVIY